MKVTLEVHELKELLRPAPSMDGTPAELQRRIEQLAGYGQKVAEAETKLRDLEERARRARPAAEAELVINGAARDVEELTDVWASRPKGKKIPKRAYDLWLSKMTKAIVQLQDRMGV
jgi:hypothetical protein